MTMLYTATIDLGHTESYTISHASWATVCGALGGGMSQVPQEILDEHDHDAHTLWIANHSMGGREWHVPAQEPALDIPFVSDPYFSGGWHILREEHVAHTITLTSASSGSRLHVELTDDADGLAWTVTLTVPVVDRVRYEGSYWRSFWGAVYEIAWARERTIAMAVAS